MFQVAGFDDYLLFIPVITGLIIVAVGHFGTVARAFRTGLGWGIATLLFPPAGLAFAAWNWKLARTTLALTVLGYLLIGGAYFVALNRGVQTTAVVETVPATPSSAKPIAETRLTLTGSSRDQYDQLTARPDYAVIQWANADVIDADLDRLIGQTALRELDLSGTRITDVGLAKLGHLTQLEVLRLSGTPITGDGFNQYLAPRSALRELDLRRTDVPKPTAREWKAASPTRKLAI